MRYQILRTDKAEDQLRDIIFYIAADSGSVDVALAYLDRLETAINRLGGPQSGSMTWSSKIVTPAYSIKPL